ncbi:hypothetical protein GCM10027291_13550 [Telluribacter humicola]
MPGSGPELVEKRVNKTIQKIRPVMIKINNESEYEKASERVEEIYNAKPGTPEKKELDELLKAIKEYDEAFIRMLRDNG